MMSLGEVGEIFVSDAEGREGENIAKVKTYDKRFGLCLGTHSFRVRDLVVQVDFPLDLAD